MGEQIERVLASPVVSHARRAVERFLSRLGSQYAAGVAYFSILAIVPVLMFAFSILGLTLTVLRTDLLVGVDEYLNTVLPPGDLGQSVKRVMVDSLENWHTVGLIGVGAGLWVGATWAKNLKRAIRVQTANDFGVRVEERSFLREMLVNAAVAVVLIVVLALVLGLASASTWFSSLIFDFLHLDDWTSRTVLSALGLFGTLIVGFGLFLFLIGVLPGRRFPRRTVVQGALIGSVGTAGLQCLASVIVAAFSQNMAAAMFGPVIVLMLFLNVFATLVLMVAAWVATAEEQPPEPEPRLQNDRRVEARPRLRLFRLE